MVQAYISYVIQAILLLCDELFTVSVPTQSALSCHGIFVFVSKLLLLLILLLMFYNISVINNCNMAGSIDYIR